MHTLWVVAVLLAALAAGCGGNGGNGDGEAGEATEEATQESVAITVHETAGVPSAFLTYGVQQGFFEEEGLDVTVEAGQGGAAAIPALLAGDAQFAGSNVVSVLLAVNEGLELRMVAPGTFVQEDPEADFAAIMVAADSDIREPSDLEGKRLAVNTLNNIAEVTAKEALQKEGVDVSTLRLREIPFPEMTPTLEAGRVDAAFLIEPFVTRAEQAGHRIVARPYVGTRPGLQIGAYVTQPSYIEENPDVAERFRAGVARTAEAIAENPDDFRAALPRIAELDPELAEQVILPDWKGEVDRDSLELIASLMVEHGLVEEEPPLDDLLAETG